MNVNSSFLKKSFCLMLNYVSTNLNNIYICYVSILKHFMSVIIQKSTEMGQKVQTKKKVTTNPKKNVKVVNVSFKRLSSEEVTKIRTGVNNYVI